MKIVQKGFNKLVVVFLLSLIMYLGMSSKVFATGIEVPSDNNNTFETAIPIQENTLVQAEINPAGDVDYYMFTPTSSEQYRVFSTSSSSNVYFRNVDGYLYDSNRVQLAVNEGQNLLIEYPLTAGQTYYIKISSDGFGAYSLAAIPSSSIPKMPTNLNFGVVSGTEVELNWTDNSDNETGFIIADATAVKNDATATQTDIDAAVTALATATTTFNNAVITALQTATAAVVKAEGSNTQADYNAAQDLVTALPNGTDKDSLQSRLDVVKSGIKQFVITPSGYLTKNGSSIKVSVTISRTTDPDVPQYDGEAFVVFQLMNGTTPEGLVAFQSNIQDSQFSAYFPVQNSGKYSVKVSVLDKFSNDPTIISLLLSRSIIVTAAPNNTDLTTAIDNAAELLASKTIGTAVGNVSQKVYEAYNAAINAATTVKNTASATQTQIDVAMADLATATTVFNGAVITVEAGVDFSATSLVQVGINPNYGDSAGIFVGLKDIRDAQGNVVPDAKLASYQIEFYYDHNQVKVFDVVDEAHLGQVSLYNETTTDKISVTDAVYQGSSNFEKLFFIPLAVTGTSINSTDVVIKFTSLSDTLLNHIRIPDVTVTLQRGKIFNEVSQQSLSIADAVAGLQYLAKMIDAGLDEGKVNVINMASILPPEVGVTGIKPSVKDVIALMQYLAGLRDDHFLMTSQITPTTGSDITGTVSKNGSMINILATSPSQDVLIIRVIRDNGNLLYVNTVSKDTDGKFANYFSIPSGLTGKITIVVGWGTNVGIAEINI